MATRPSEADLAAQVIERLLTDPAFRARFRRDPAGACRDAGLDGLAQEMSLGGAGGKAFHTLDMRESRSSLAGVMMAAAMEGVGIYQFSENVLPHLEELPRKVADVVSRIDLPAIKLPDIGGGDAVKASDGGGAATAVPPPELGGASAPPAGGAGVTAAPAGRAGATPVSGAAAAGTLPSEGASSPAGVGGAEDANAAAPAETAAPAEPDKAKEAADAIAAADSPEAQKEAAVSGASDALAEQGAAPDSSGLPSGGEAPGTAPASSGSLPEAPAPDTVTAPPDPAGAAPGLPETAPATDAPPGLPQAPESSNALPEAPVSNGSLPEAPPAGLEQISASAPGPSPAALALVGNQNLVLDSTGVADLQSGRVDSRVVDVLTELSSKHKLTVTSLAGGVDIGAIDGEAVSPDSPLARDLASELSSLNPRPDQIGSPFQISGQGYYTDNTVQNHLHIAFAAAPAAPVAPGVPVVAPVAQAAAVAPVAAAPAVAPVAAALPVEPAAPVRDSQIFQAVGKASAASAGGGKRTDSQMFLKAVEPPKASASAAPAQPVASAAAAEPALVDLSAAPDAYPGDDAPREQVAAWMAAQAEKRGLPPELPLMASLVESGMKNLNFGDADSVGFFQMRVSIWNQGPYAGYADKPELQVKWFLDEAEKVKNARVAAGKPIDDPNSYGEWIADTERPAAQYRGRYQTKLEEAQGLLKSRPAAGAVAPAPVVEAAAAVPAGGGGGTSPLGSAALTIAKTQLGVAETGGANRGQKVEEYLAAAKVAPGNPWCASFVTWALGKAGHEMPGGGWAAVQTWVRAAEQGKNGLEIVSADQARPGDIVVYDWGGQEDFAGDGHIGFLDSTVQNGKFTALEGNNADKVNSVPRQMGGANIKFLRIEGQGTAAAAAAPAAPVAPVAPAVQYIQPNTPYAQPPIAVQPGAVVAPDTPYAQPGAAQPVAAAVDAAQAAPRKPIDPAQFGGDGTGGAPDPEALALLKNKNIVLDADGIKDIKAGRIDPRVVAVMTKLSQEHKITVTCMCSDHDKFTAGGSVSNHHFGRGMDIGAIDGEIVGPGSPLARAVASELSTLNADMRPNEIGSPFAIAGPGYFTDAAHQNHLHIGFKEAITSDWKPPADVTAGGAPAAAPVASAAAAAPVAAPALAVVPPVQPAAPVRDSQLFQAVGKASAASAGGGGKRTDSQMFLKAVEEPQASASAAAPQPVASAAAVQPGAPVVDVAAVAAAAPDAYPGDSAPREQIAAWMAGQAEKRGLPPQLPLMASLVESGMKNLNFGDADSVGFFQMRVGIWNQGAYAGYPDKPELQVKWFLDQAEAVKRQRLAAGKSVTDQNQFGEWIADVERPAAQYRGRYQTKLEEANGLLASAPSAQPAAAVVAQPVAAPVVDPAAAAAAAPAGGLPPEIMAPLQEAIAAGNAPGPKAMAAIQEATKYLGTDYKWGGSTPQTGFDCSGLMQWAYAQSGVQIPRVTYTQIEAANGVEVADRAALKPGDLVFFAANGDVHHVGMFLGGDKFIHAPHTGDVVKVSSLSEPYYAGQFAGGRRFDAGAGVAVPAGAPAVAPVASAAAAAPAIDPNAVAQAQAAVARDAAEVRRNDSQLFQAIKAVESKKDEQVKSNSMMFLKAVDPADVKRPVAAAPVASAAAAAPPSVIPPVAPAAAAPPVTPAVNVSAPAPAGGGGVGAVSVDLSAAAAEYPGNNASQAELAKWLSKQAERAGLPPELPVMASLVESGVKNLNYGDRDSVGFFQMRTAIWNQGAYKGYPEKPELQAKWFIDQALALKRKRIAEGDANFGTDPSKFGQWIADVERPAEEYRGRYQLRLDEARKLLST